MDFSNLIEHLLVTLTPLFETYGYPLVFLSALAEHTFFLAWAVPGGILVSFGGIYAQSGALWLPLVIAVALLGFMAGDHLDYFVGRRSQRLVHKATKGKTLPVDRFWNWKVLPAMLLAYTNTIPRVAMFMGGAASGLPYRRFLPVSFSLALFWSITDSLIGYWIGSNREELARALKTVGLTGQLLLLTIIVGAGIVFFVRKNRNRGKEPLEVSE